MLMLASGLMGPLLTWAQDSGASTHVFAKTADGPLHLDIHLPKTGTNFGPTILWIHGGGWRQGSRVNWHLVDWLPEKGCPVVSIDYRLTDTAPFPAQINDCRAALAWLREHGEDHGVDPKHIVVAGLSAGAHLASLLGLSDNSKTTPLRGILHFYGPCDFIAMMKYAKKPTDVLNTPAAPVYALLGGALRDHAELAEQASPVTYLDAEDPPILIFVGTKDSLMTQRQCGLLETKAGDAGVKATLHTIEGAGHGGPAFSDETRQKQILDFLKSVE